VAEEPFPSAEAPDDDADGAGPEALPGSSGLQAVRERPAARTTRARTESFLLLRICFSVDRMPAHPMRALLR
jgi:hypothetical protein